MFKEDLENGSIDTAMVRKKLKSNFPLYLFETKKEKEILDSLTYRIKKAVEMKQSMMSQIGMKLKIQRISVT